MKYPCSRCGKPAVAVQAYLSEQCRKKYPEREAPFGRFLCADHRYSRVYREDFGWKIWPLDQAPLEALELAEEYGALELAGLVREKLSNAV